jgi:glucosylceramidase
MRYSILGLILLTSTLIFLQACSEDSSSSKSFSDVSFWVSKADKSMLMTQNNDALSEKVPSAPARFFVNQEQRFQEMDGFGFALTGGSASHLMGMTAANRTALLRELFSDDEGAIAMSYIRITIGASDLDDNPFSYNDMPNNVPDESLSNFSIDPDRAMLIPVLKEILAINPDIKIMGSPWSPPAWMKTNKSTIGGELLERYYDAYANYFVKYIKAYAAEGITINAITIQNEPLHGGNNPSLYMPADQQNNFIKQSLGPIFQNEGISTKIIIYDHNADRTDYPIEILDDSVTRSYVDGSAFHLYGGSINDLSKVKEAHPDKKIYFTEQWYSSVGDFGQDMLYHSSVIFTGGALNWCSAIIEWNLSSNATFTPHTDGGCTMCKGAISINGNDVERNAGYYAVGHYSKFVKPGAIRLNTNQVNNMSAVAFQNPDNSLAFVLTNDAFQDVLVTIEADGISFSATVPSRSISTFTW